MNTSIEPFLSDLEPRVCGCGEPTGSVALDTCAACSDKDGAS